MHARQPCKQPPPAAANSAWIVKVPSASDRSLVENFADQAIWGVLRLHRERLLPRGNATVLRTVLILTILLAAAPATAGQRYYMALFAAQDCGLNWPRNAHTFATFVSVEECDGVAVADSWHQFTISWMPACLEVNIFNRAETGANLDLETTLGLYADCAKLYQWGPYEICSELYCQAVEQHERLLSGKVQYRALDLMFAENIDNCIHSVAGVVLPNRRYFSGTARGYETGRQLVLRMRKWIVAECVPEEISLRLGLDEFPLHPQPFPNATPLRTSIRHMLLVAPPRLSEE